MKSTLLALGLCFLSATMAHGQNGYGGTALNNQAQVYEFQAHTERATQKAMGQSENLLGEAGYTYGRGERPLWEFASASQPVPLGDTARTLKKEHATQRKAEIIWQN
jgi:hypothetical protein